MNNEHTAEKDVDRAAAIARVLTAHQYSRRPMFVGHCTCGHVTWSPVHQAQALLASRFIAPPAVEREAAR